MTEEGRGDWCAREQDGDKQFVNLSWFDRLWDYAGGMHFISTDCIRGHVNKLVVRIENDEKVMQYF